MNTAQHILRITDHLAALALTHKPVAVITGATGTVGRALVHELAGDYVIIAQGRDVTRLAALGQEGPEIYPVRYDLTDTTGYGATFGQLPRVDALVHCAAVTPHCSFEDASTAIWQAALHLNVTVPAELTRIMLPQLRKAAGSVVLLGSAASTTTTATTVVEAAVKHALGALAEGIRQRVAPDGVRVATVTPEVHRQSAPDWEQPVTGLLAPGARILPSTVARTIRTVIQAPADAQLTDVRIQPRGA